MKKNIRRVLSSLAVGSLLIVGGTTVVHADPAIPSGLQGSYLPNNVANDPSCVPSKEHPYPVIFIHGTTANATTWTKAITALNKEGFCSWAFNYGKEDISKPMHPEGEFGNEDINKSAQELARVVDYVLAKTGAKKVNLVGHSQGGTLTKIYIQEHGGAAKVHRSIGLSPTYHGTTLKGMSMLARPLIDVAPSTAAALVGTASTQQVVGSKEIEHLNSVPDTDPRVIYTNIYTPVDRIATPNETSQLLSVGGADVANVNLSQVCSLSAFEQVSHENMPLNSNAINLVFWGLTRSQGELKPQLKDCKRL